MPTHAQMNNGDVWFTYDALGNKWYKYVGDDVRGEKHGTAYIFGMQYEFKYNDYVQYDWKLMFIGTDEGYVSAVYPDGIDSEFKFQYVYNHTDHLGNIRQNITRENERLTVLREHNYYPFGLLHRGYNEEKEDLKYDKEQDFIFTVQAQAGRYKYKFQGQERQEDLDLGWDSFKYRNYDYAIGRFFNVDPLAEKFPYNGVYNFSENRVVDGVELEGLEYLDVDNPNIGKVTGNDNDGYSFKLGEESFENVEKVDIKGKSYYVLGKDMYYNDDNGWSTSGSEEDKQTQLINTPATATVTDQQTGIAVVRAYPVSNGNLYQVPLYRMVVSGRDPRGNKYSENFNVIRFGVYNTAYKGPMVVGLSDDQTHTMKWDYISTMDGYAWRIWKGHFLHDGPDYPTSQFYGSIGCIEVTGRGEWNRLQNLVLTKTGQTSYQDISKKGLFKIHLEFAPRPPLQIYSR